MTKTNEIKTLRELGIPAGLAKEMESTLRLMGKTKGDRITGFIFVANDGSRHELRAEAEVERRAIAA